MADDKTLNQKVEWFRNKYPDAGKTDPEVDRALTWKYLKERGRQRGIEYPDIDFGTAQQRADAKWETRGQKLGEVVRATADIPFAVYEAAGTLADMGQMRAMQARAQRAHDRLAEFKGRDDLSDFEKSVQALSLHAISEYQNALGGLGANPVLESGEAMHEWFDRRLELSREALAFAPERDIAGDFAAGIASTVPAIAATALGGPGAGLATMSGMMGGQNYREAQAAGKDGATLVGAYLGGAAIGATEMIPVARAFGRISKMGGKKGRDKLIGLLGVAAAGAGEEGIQEFGQTVLEGILSQHILEYADKQSFTALMSDALYSGFIGLMVGGVLGGGGAAGAQGYQSAVSRRRRQLANQYAEGSSPDAIGTILREADRVYREQGATRAYKDLVAEAYTRMDPAGAEARGAHLQALAQVGVEANSPEIAAQVKAEMDVAGPVILERGRELQKAQAESDLDSALKAPVEPEPDSDLTGDVQAANVAAIEGALRNLAASEDVELDPTSPRAVRNAMLKAKLEQQLKAAKAVTFRPLESQPDGADGEFRAVDDAILQTVTTLEESGVDVPEIVVMESAVPLPIQGAYHGGRLLVQVVNGVPDAAKLSRSILFHELLHARARVGSQAFRDLVTVMREQAPEFAKAAADAYVARVRKATGKDPLPKLKATSPDAWNAAMIEEGLALAAEQMPTVIETLLTSPERLAAAIQREPGLLGWLKDLFYRIFARLSGESVETVRVERKTGERMDIVRLNELQDALTELEAFEGAALTPADALTAAEAIIKAYKGVGKAEVHAEIKRMMAEAKDVASRLLPAAPERPRLPAAPETPLLEEPQAARRRRRPQEAEESFRRLEGEDVDPGQPAGRVEVPGDAAAQESAIPPPEREGQVEVAGRRRPGRRIGERRVEGEAEAAPAPGVTAASGEEVAAEVPAPAPEVAPSEAPAGVNKPLAVAESSYTLDPSDRRDGYQLYLVDPDVMDAELARDRTRYVGPLGTGQAIGDRYERFRAWVIGAPFKGAPGRRIGQLIEAATVGYSDGGMLFVDNGRHRLAALRDMGAPVVVAMRATDAARAREAGIVTGEVPDAGQRVAEAPEAQQVEDPAGVEALEAEEREVYDYLVSEGMAPDAALAELRDMVEEDASFDKSGFGERDKQRRKDGVEPDRFSVASGGMFDPRAAAREQTYTSERTSLNQVPASFKGVDWKPGTINFDIGGGAYDLGTEYLSEQGVTNLIYDPFNRSRLFNMKNVARAKGGVDTVTVANVLNVIAERGMRNRVLREAAAFLKPGGEVYIQVYEGDGKGESRVTAKGWQEHRKLDTYTPEVREVFGEVERKGKVLIAKSPLEAQDADEAALLMQAEQAVGMKRHPEYGVGKLIGGDLYVEKSHMDRLPQKVQRIARRLAEQMPGYDYKVVKWNEREGTVSFIQSPDFDTAQEPLVTASVKYTPGKGFGRQTKHSNVYHHKWLFVAPDYAGFDVGESYQRTLDVVDMIERGDKKPSQLGTKKAWDEFTGGASRFSVAAPLDSPEFRRWFGNSKVVDAEGRPLVVYHGTLDRVDRGEVTPDFTEFWPLQHFGTSEAANDRVRHLRNRIVSSTNRGDVRQRVYPAFLSIQNPLSIEDGGDGSLQGLRRAVYRALGLGEAPSSPIVDDYYKHNHPSIGEDILRVAEEAGYDGLTYRNRVEDRGSDSWVAFRPEQIKSATGNVGAFGQRPVTEAEAAPLGMTAAEANEAQARGDVRFSVAPFEGSTHLLHGTSEDFGAFDPGRAGHGVFYFSDAGNRYSRRQADAIAGRSGRMVEVHVDLGRLRRFDPLNDPDAAEIMRAAGVEPNLDWVEYPDMGDVAPLALDAGYELFRVREPAVADFSWAIRADEPELQRIVNRPTSSPDMRYSVAPADQMGFYSNTEDALEAMVAKSGARKLKRDLAVPRLLSSGASKEEVAWMGLEEWLRAHPDPRVPVEDIREFIRANTVIVGEKVLGGDSGGAEDADDIHLTIGSDREYVGWEDPEFDEETAEVTYTVYADNADIEYRVTGSEWSGMWYASLEDSAYTQVGEGFTSEEDAHDAIREHAWEQIAAKAGTDGPARHSEYQLPGGEEYRELLLTLPVAGGVEYSVYGASDGKEVARYKTREEASAHVRREPGLAWEEFRDGERVHEAYTGGHYGDTPNVLAHVRFNERVGPSGERILFIEEVQSDWHQAGREGGYATKREGSLAPDALYVFRESTEEIVAGPFSREGDAYAAMEDRRGLNYKFGSEFSDRLRGAPDAPFKQGWEKLAMRRMVRWAAENGFDRVAWTSGVQQVERYETSYRQAVNEIKWTPTTAGEAGAVDVDVETTSGETLELEVTRDGAVKSTDPNLDGQGIAAVVGKVIAKRILSEESGVASGDDLTIGGEGMKAAYDRRLVGIANKLGKRFGAKVEGMRLRGESPEGGAVGVRRGGSPEAQGLSPIPYEEAFRLVSEGRSGEVRVGMEASGGQNISGVNASPRQFARLQGRRGVTFYRSGGPITDAGPLVHSLPITDAMRESAMTRGFPRFSVAATDGDLDPRADGAIQYGELSRLELVRRRMQDYFYPVRKAQRAIGEVPESMDVDLAETTFSGRAGARLLEFEDAATKELNGILGDDLTLDDAHDFAYAAHAPERNEWIAKKFPDQGWGTEVKPGSGMRTSEARRTVKEKLEGEHGDRYRRLNRFLRRMARQQIRTLDEAGLLTQDFKDAVAAQGYKYYVPLIHTMKGRPTIVQGRGFNVRGSGIKKAGGRVSAPDNVVLNLLAKNQEAIVRSEKAKVDRALYNLVTAHPDPTLWTVMDVPTRIEDDGAGVLKQLWDARIDKVEQTVFATIDGEVKAIVFAERGADLARALNKTGVDGAHSLLRKSRKVLRYLAAINTSWNPEFVLTNFLRDAQTAGIVIAGEGKGGMMAVLKGAAPAIRDIYRHERGGQESSWWQRMKDAGGKTGWYHAKSLDEIQEDLAKTIKRLQREGPQRALNAGHAIAQFIDDANSAVENGVRLSAFKWAVQNGASDARAAEFAKNLTVNFNRQGEAQWLSSMYMFANASIQGSMRVATTLVKSKYGKRIAGGLVLGGFLADLLNYAMSPDDEDGENSWDAQPEYAKDRYFMLPKGDGTFVSIPMPYGFNFFQTLGRKMGELARYAAGEGGSKPTQAGADLLSSALGAFSPVGDFHSADWQSGLRFVSPTVLDPMVELATNRNWRNQPIRPEGSPFDRVDPPAHTVAWDSTNPIWKNAAGALNWMTGGDEFEEGHVSVSPEDIQYLVEFGLGGVLRFGNRTLNTFHAMPKSPVQALSDAPFLRQLHRTESERKGWQVFRESAVEIEWAKNKYDVLRERGDREGAEEVRKELGHMLDLHRDLQRIDRRRRRMRTKIEAAEGAEKDELTDALYSEIRAFNRKVSDARQ